MKLKILKNLAVVAVAFMILVCGNNVDFAEPRASTMRKSGTLRSHPVRAGRMIMCPVRDDLETHYEVHDISGMTFETTVESRDDSSEKHYTTYDMSRIVNVEKISNFNSIACHVGKR